MAIIIVKPTDPGADNYQSELDNYNQYLNTIRSTMWSGLTSEDVLDSEIDNVVALGAAERDIIRRSGITIPNEGFSALPQSDQDKLLEATILRTALFLLPSVPQFKRTDVLTSENEFFQVELEDREDKLTARLDELYPDPDVPATIGGNLFPTGGEILTWDVELC